jgi:hypothetical protein
MVFEKERPVNHARSSRWILILCLALSAVLAAWYFGWRAVTRVPAADAQTRVLTANDMLESILTQAQLPRQQKWIMAETSAMWVRIANPTPVANTNRRYLPEETCFVEGGEKAVLINADNNRLLLRYAPRLRPSGSACPDGTLFVLNKGKAAEWSTPSMTADALQAARR